MDGLRVGFRLVRESWRLLRQDKELLLLPLAGTVAMAGLGLGLWLLVFQRWPHGDDFRLPGLLRAFPVMAVAGLPATFTNAAVVAGARERLRGGDPDLRSCLAVAWERRWQLLRWSLLAALVGFGLQVLAERLKLAGRIASMTIGLGWQLAITFVVPVILFEREPVAEAVRRSATLFEQRWGAEVGGLGAIGAAVVLVTLPAIVLVGVVGALLGPVALAVVVAVAAGAVIAFTGALGGTFNAALYEYAVTGEVRGPYAEEDVAGAYRPKLLKRRFRR